MTGSHRTSSRTTHHSTGMDPFGDMMGGFGGFGGMGGSSSVSISTNMGGFGGGSFTSSSTSMHTGPNGERIEKTVTNQNGVETVEIKKNGVLTSKTVNGAAQAIENNNTQQQHAAIHNHSRRTNSSRSRRENRGSRHQQVSQQTRQMPHHHHQVQHTRSQPTTTFDDYADNDAEYDQQMA